tara:strand:- start:2255 stop:3055 length:801 start_codon:yes stop_codon:yes gene_type:complete
MTVKKDFRARIQAKPGSKNRVYGNKNPVTNLIAPLWQTNGMLMPYTPAIQVTHTSVEYAQYSLPQTPFDYFAFSKRNSPMLSVTATYTAQNQAEARYVLAVLHFLRAITMNYYGRQNGELRGINPPTLLFSAYGPYMYDRVPMLIRNVSFGLDQDVDYVSCGTSGVENVNDTGYGMYSNSPEYSAQTDLDVSGAEAAMIGGTTFSDKQINPPAHLEDKIAQSYVPSVVAMFMELVYAPTPAKMRDEFDLEKFKSGQYINDTDEGII